MVDFKSFELISDNGHKIADVRYLERPEGKVYCLYDLADVFGYSTGFMSLVPQRLKIPGTKFRFALWPDIKNHVLKARRSGNRGMIACLSKREKPEDYPICMANAFKEASVFTETKAGKLIKALSRETGLKALAAWRLILRDPPSFMAVVDNHSAEFEKLTLEEIKAFTAIEFSEILNKVSLAQPKIQKMDSVVDRGPEEEANKMPVGTTIPLPNGGNIVININYYAEPKKTAKENSDKFIFPVQVNSIKP